MTTSVPDILRTLTPTPTFDVSAATIRRLPSGHFCEAWQISAPSTPPLVLRRPLQYAPGRAQKERVVSREVHKALHPPPRCSFAFRIPQVLALGPAGETLSDYCTGVALTEVPRQLAADAASGCGQLLACLHRIRCSAWGIISPDGFPPPDDDWNPYLDWWGQRMAGWMPSRASDIATLRSRIVCSTRCARLLHRDPSPGNFLVDCDARVIALIDWEFAIAGDPLLDVAVFRVESASRPDLICAFQRGYSSISPPDPQDVRTIGHYTQLHYWDSRAFAEKHQMASPIRRAPARHVVFDISGTLARPLHSLPDAYHNALQEIAGMTVDAERLGCVLARHHHAMTGPLRHSPSPQARAAVYDALNKRILTDLRIRLCSRALTDAVLRLTALSPHPSAHGVLRTLRQAGYTLYAASNGPVSLARTLDMWGLASYLEKVVTSDELGITKPDPTFYQRLAELTACDLSAQIPVFVGDSLTNDGIGPYCAGYRPILIGVKPDTAARQGLMSPLDCFHCEDLAHVPQCVRDATQLT